MTIQFFPEDIKSKVIILLAFYFFCGPIHEFIMTFRHSCAIPPIYFLFTGLPSCICIIVMSYWTFSALNAQILKLSERKQPEKLKLFQRLRYCLSFSAVAFSGASLLSVFDVFAGREYWAWSWFLADGVPHLLYALILVVMMSLWVPNEHSLMLAFSRKPGKGGDVADTEKGKSAEEESKAVWEDPSEGDGDGKESFWDSMGGPKFKGDGAGERKSAAEPAVVGAITSSANEEKGLKETDALCL